MESTAEVGDLLRVLSSSLSHVNWRLRPSIKRRLETDIMAFCTKMRPVVIFDYGGKMPEVKQQLCAFWKNCQKAAIVSRVFPMSTSKSEAHRGYDLYVTLSGPCGTCQSPAQVWRKSNSSWIRSRILQRWIFYPSNSPTCSSHQEEPMSFSVPNDLSMGGAKRAMGLCFPVVHAGERCRYAWSSLQMEVSECYPQAIVLEERRIQL